MVAGAFMGRDKYRQMQREAWAKELVTRLRPHVDGTLNKEEPSLPDEASYLKLLYFLHVLETKSLDVEEIIREACSQLGYVEPRVGAVNDHLLLNFETAKRFKMFDDDAKLAKLADGEPVPIVLSGWEGELCGVGQIITADKAPEIANCLPNLVLLPAIARDAQDGTISSLTQEHARYLSQAGFLGHSAREALLQMKKPGR